MKSKTPKISIERPSQMHPIISTRLGPYVFSKFANIGAKMAIEIEYAEKTIPWIDVGTPFFNASCG